MDGVIIDSEPAHFDAFRTVLKEMSNTVLTQRAYNTYFAGKTDRQGFIDYFLSIDYTPSISLEKLIDHKSRIYSRASFTKIRPYSHTIDFLSKLPKACRCALVTSSTQNEVDTVLDHFNIRRYFSAIVTADDVKHGKPSPDGYNLAAQRLGVEPSQCIAIEDSPAGVQAALSAGMKCLALTTTHPKNNLSAATAVTPHLSAKLFNL
jgi:beta-phosphoglucomutase